MKLHDIIAEEMGVFGMDRIRKGFYNVAKNLGLPTKDYDIQQSSNGSTITIFKNKKPFATVPAMKATSENFLSDVLTRGK